MDDTYRTGTLAHVGSFAEVVTPGAAAILTSNASFTMPQEVSLICKMQQDLAKEAAVRFDFEKKWRASSDEKRREVILEGIYRTMSIQTMEDRRKWCPDSTLDHMASENGETYLRMLKSLLLSPSRCKSRIPSWTGFSHSVPQTKEYLR